MFKVTYNIVYATGAPEHKYWTGKGAALSKSPKRAMRAAMRIADRSVGDGANYGYVLAGGSVENLSTGKVVKFGDGVFTK